MRSARVLVFIATLPRALPFLIVAGLIAAGVLLHGAAAAVCLLLVVVLFGWLLYLSWPALPPNARVIRVAVVTVLSCAAAMTAFR
jgi:hypothetical protein